VASYLLFADGPAGLRIEIEDGTTPMANPSLAGLMESIAGVAAQAAARIAQLPPDQRPTDVAIDFGVEALPTGDYAIGRDLATANIRVAFTWSQEPAVATPEAPGPEGMFP
jgi:hypothetical protein